MRDQSRQRIIVKAREIGVSQTIAGEAIWEAKWHPESNIVFISRNGTEAKKLINYCRVLSSEDPDLGIVSGSQEIKIPSYRPETCLQALDARGTPLFSDLIAEAASQSAGRGGGKRCMYIDEFAHGNFRFWGREIWQSVRPAIALGGGITFISTPKGKNNMFYRLYRESLAGLNSFTIQKLPWDVCPVYNPLGFHLEDPDERRRVGEQSEWFLNERLDYSDAEWAEEYGCDFTSSAGLVYPEFNELLSIGDFSYEPRWDTFVGQDFGFNNPSVALIIQVSPSEDIFILKEHYVTNRSLGSLAKDEYHSFAQKFKVQDWICDGSDPQKVEELRDAGLPAIASPRREVEQGINEVRKFLKVPVSGHTRVHIDRSCQNFITDLVTYAYKPEKDEPEKDINDHGPDAFRYFITWLLRRAMVSNSYTWGNTP